MSLLKFIVTGTGRCGTVFMARLLTSLGIPCGHESIFNLSLIDFRRRVDLKDFQLSICSQYDTLKKENVPEWIKPKEIQADSSYMAAPFLKGYRVGEIPLIHVTRNPLSVISSFVLDGMFFTYKDAECRANTDLHEHLVNHVVPYEEFMMRYVPELREPNLPVWRACKFYVRWVEMIEMANDGRPFYRHKIEDGVTDELLKFLEVERSEKMYDNPNINSWKKRLRDYKLYDVPNSIRDEFVETAARMGYAL